LGFEIRYSEVGFGFQTQIEEEKWIKKKGWIILSLNLLRAHCETLVFRYPLKKSIFI